MSNECSADLVEPPQELRALVIIANIIGFIYNIPQVVYTIRTKSANDISGIFLTLRILSACLWLIYTSILWSPDVFISWVITGTASGILVYYKIRYATEPWYQEIFVLCPCVKQLQSRQQLQEEPSESV
jgi:uncharacterized protein with PQ loop repeat